jgi:NifU-like protein involved in Fe-S cluster formation
LPSASIASGSALLEAVATVSQASKVKDTAAKMAKGNEEKKQPEVAKRQRNIFFTSSAG